MPHALLFVKKETIQKRYPIFDELHQVEKFTSTYGLSGQHVTKQIPMHGRFERCVRSRNILEVLFTL
jgi:hypothetical protein